jgi:hypothetical protein
VGRRGRGDRGRRDRGRRDRGRRDRGRRDRGRGDRGRKDREREWKAGCRGEEQDGLVRLQKGQRVFMSVTVFTDFLVPPIYSRCVNTGLAHLLFCAHTAH